MTTTINYLSTFSCTLMSCSLQHLLASSKSLTLCSTISMDRCLSVSSCRTLLRNSCSSNCSELRFSTLRMGWLRMPHTCFAYYHIIKTCIDG